MIHVHFYPRNFGAGPVGDDEPDNLEIENEGEGCAPLGATLRGVRSGWHLESLLAGPNSRARGLRCHPQL